jgi:hypothetical protein
MPFKWTSLFTLECPVLNALYIGMSVSFSLEKKMIGMSVSNKIIFFGKENDRGFLK